MSCVELRPVLAQVRGREGGPGDLQGSLHHADIQAAQQPEVDALFARWVQHSAFLSITTLQTYNQHKIYLISECPLHTQMFKYPSVFNWTATYRRDSTVVAPYERWQYYNENVR